jgi:hypothetical protein
VRAGEWEQCVSWGVWERQRRVEGGGGGQEGGAGGRVKGGAVRVWREGTRVARVDGWMVFICSADHLNRLYHSWMVRNDWAMKTESKTTKTSLGPFKQI